MTNNHEAEPSTEKMVKTLRTSLRAGLDGCGYWRDLHEAEAFEYADRLEAQEKRIKELEKALEYWVDRATK